MSLPKEVMDLIEKVQKNPEALLEVLKISTSHSEHEVTFYKGYTIITLKDGVDADWSAVAKPGYYLNDAAMKMLPCPFEHLVTIVSKDTRKLALDAAITAIDAALPTVTGHQRTAVDILAECKKDLSAWEIDFLQNIQEEDKLSTHQWVKYAEIQEKVCKLIAEEARDILAGFNPRS